MNFATHNLKNLIKDPTCFKNAQNPTSIDMILTNRSEDFRTSCCIETGISDFHKMVISILNADYKKIKPTKVRYSNYKKFNIGHFKAELTQSLRTYELENITYDEFKETFVGILNKHAPMKEKLIRGNNAPFMNKTLSKAFMLRARLKNRYNKSPTEENKTIYKKQRNYCSNLLKRGKKKYYNNLDTKIFKENKTFWNSIRPFFSDKQKKYQKELVLIEKDVITSKKTEVADKMNNYFVDSIKNLDIEPFLENNSLSCNIDEIISAYNEHPSIMKIKENVIITEKCSFKKSTVREMHEKILTLDPTKASVENDIPTKILIESNDISDVYLTNIYNNSIDRQKFSDSLKHVIPTHKKEEKSKKENYRPISLLSAISKLYERDMYVQILHYIEKYFSPYLFGFRKGCSTEQCLNVMLETWKKALDKKTVGAVLTDLSKAFDCLKHKLLIAKLAAYGFDREDLTFTYNYLSNRKLRTKIKSHFSSRRDILYGVTQGSILGPLLFNIFLNDIFLFIENANYADDTTPYAIETSIEKLMQQHQYTFKLV